MEGQCGCRGSQSENRKKYRKKFRIFGKRNRDNRANADGASTSAASAGPSHGSGGTAAPTPAPNCPICAQRAHGSASGEQCQVDIYEEKQRIRTAAVARPDPASNQAYAPPENLPKPNCNCTKCRRARGEDPLTVELLPMDTQVTLQHALQDSAIMCVIL